MQRNYHQWYSPALGRQMELLVFGHAGAPILVFPTSQGRFFEYEDHGMVAALEYQLENGLNQLICVDSVDAESWYNYAVSPRERLARHDSYERYVIDEVLPFVQQINDNPFLMVHGCSFGAIHAMLFGLRYPHLFGRVLAFAGYYNTSRFLENYYDEQVHLHHPINLVRYLHDPEIIQQLRRMDIIMAIGRDDSGAASNQALSDALWEKGIWHAMRWWDGWAHDWPFWQQMMLLYINGPQ